MMSVFLLSWPALRLALNRLDVDAERWTKAIVSALNARNSNAESFGSFPPIHDGSVDYHGNLGALVDSLLAPSRPTAVELSTKFKALGASSTPIPVRIVRAIKRMVGRWSVPHIGEKRLNRMHSVASVSPAVANRNAAPAIVPIGRMLGIVATADHSMPSGSDICAAVPMRSVNLGAKATATAFTAGCEIRGSNENIPGPAGAITSPHDMAFVIIGRTLANRKPLKRFAGQIKECVRGFGFFAQAAAASLLAAFEWAGLGKIKLAAIAGAAPNGKILNAAHEEIDLKPAKPLSGQVGKFRIFRGRNCDSILWTQFKHSGKLGSHDQLLTAGYVGSASSAPAHPFYLSPQKIQASPLPREIAA